MTCKLYTLDNQLIEERDNCPHKFTGIAEYPDGTKYWYFEGKWHRLDGPAIEYYDGAKSWWVKGNRHRLDGHAIEYSNGTKYWYVNNKHHRLDGPAIEWMDGSKHWYINDKRVTEQQCNLLHSTMKLKGLI